ncbi:MAG TPA: hypothetical protein VNA89_13125 [Gemmatimonadaceae bacterium]|nr:hypothetical protein [Gemmatimonadaceae bacterium]
MSVVVMCPACQAAEAYDRPPVAVCGRCGRRYPDAVRAPAERALGRPRAVDGDMPPKPALLVLGQFASAFAGAVFLLGVPLAAFDVGTFTVHGQQVSGPEFLRRGGGPAFAATGALLLTVAVGLWRGRPWARPLMLAYWPVAGGLTIALAPAGARLEAAWTTLTFALAGGLLAAWYLYGRRNVAAYFGAL